MDYPTGTEVTLTAPLFVEGNKFQKWLRNGSDFAFTPQIVITVQQFSLARDMLTLTAVYVSSIPCLHPSTLVSIGHGKEVSISTLKAGDRVLDIHGRLIPIIKNMKFKNTNEFVMIKKGSIDKIKNIPSTDIYIRKDHPIMYQGQEIEAKKLIKILGSNKVRNIKLEEVVPVWSIATKERTFIMMSGIPVCTWASSDARLTTYTYTSF